MKLETQSIIVAATILTPLVLLGVYKYRDVVFRIARASLFLAVLGGVCMGAYYNWPSKEVIEKIVQVQVEVPVFIEKEPKTILQALEEVAPKYNVRPEIYHVLIKKESAGGKGRMDSIKFEAHYMSRAAKITRNPEEQRMYASSHGALQVMGTLAHEYGYTWSDMYVPEKNAEVGMAYMGKCLERHQGKSKYDQYYNAFKCYNGADSYARDAMEILARDVIERNL